MVTRQACDKRPCLYIESIPERAFIPVIRKVNILKAQIDSQGGIKNDIRIQSPMGDSTNIQRKELLKNYKYLQNKKINLHGWKKEKVYTVFQRDNSQLFAMQVPINLRASVNGNIANRGNNKVGDYIVCYGGADGKVDKRTASLMQAKMFHKMFSIPEHEVIQRNKGKRNKYFKPQRKFIVQPQNGNRAVLNPTIKRQSLKEPYTKSQVHLEKPNVPQPTNPAYKVNTATLPGVNKSIARPLDTPKKNNIRTVGKLLRGQTLVGFAIQNGKSIKKLNKEQMKALIANGTVTDIMVQKNSYGVEYFRGNGIQIENLPSQQV